MGLTRVQLVSNFVLVWAGKSMGCWYKHGAVRTCGLSNCADGDCNLGSVVVCTSWMSPQAAKLPSITVSWPAGLEVIGAWQCFQQHFFIKSKAKLAFAIKPLKQHCLSLSMLMAVFLIGLTDLPINTMWGPELPLHCPGLQSCVGPNGLKWSVV